MCGEYTEQLLKRIDDGIKDQAQMGTSNAPTDSVETLPYRPTEQEFKEKSKTLKREQKRKGAKKVLSFVAGPSLPPILGKPIGPWDLLPMVDRVKQDLATDAFNKAKQQFKRNYNERRTGKSLGSCDSANNTGTDQAAE